MNSSWVILEDLDSAPLDVLSVLMPLLQTGDLFISELGRTLKAGEKFRLFATLR